MIKHYLKTAWRNIQLNGLVSFIKIAGMALGLATFILGARYVQFEKSYDTFHTNSKRIFRIQSYKFNDKRDVSFHTSFPTSQYLLNTIPEIEKATITRIITDELLSSEPDLVFQENNGYLADSSVFSFFSFEFIEGNPNTCLNNENAIVLAESLAGKLFPDQPALGKTIKSSLRNDLFVSAIIKDPKPNTHIRPSYFVSSQQVAKYAMKQWENKTFSSYVLLKPNVKIETVNSKIKTILGEKVKNNERYLYLRPLEQLHINPDDSGRGAFTLRVIFFVVILILVLSSLNFMNLSTAYSSFRSKEIGVRKVSGGSSKMLRFQYLFESSLYAFIALFFALIIAKLALNKFNHIVDREIPLNYLSNPELILIIIGVTLLTGILSGLYPAFIISSFKTVKVLKGLNPLNKQKGKKAGIRTMVIIQFVLTAILIYTSTWAYFQVNYLEKRDLGFNKEDLLHLKIQENQNNINYSDFKNRLLAKPGIEQVGLCLSPPMCEHYGAPVLFEGQIETASVYSTCNFANADYIKTIGASILKGRNFYENAEQNEGTCLLNKTAVIASGWKNHPLGKWVQINDKKYKVVGIINDLHNVQIHQKNLPSVLLPHDENLNRRSTLIIKVNPNSLASSYRYIKKVYSETYPDHFLQLKNYDEAMSKEGLKIWKSGRNTLGLFAVIAILISVFALFALVIFATQKRKKEIGIRKVQGAKFFQIYRLVIKEFVLIVIFASIITLPVPGLLVRIMPGIYKYHFQLFEYSLVFFILLLIALVPVSYHAFRASNRNPVETLRYE